MSSLSSIFRKYIITNFTSLRESSSGINYWKRRAKILGKRAVLNKGHTEEEIDAVTDMQRKEIYPHFLNTLRGDEKLVLDFGCGTGRFTHDLARMIGGAAIGIDPIRNLIKMAPISRDVTYKVMTAGHIPLPDDHVDIVWICLVLGGLEGNVLLKSINEIDRVLRKGGLLFLIENTAELQRSAHWIFRTFDEYKALFTFCALKHLHDYYDLGERISVMAGRKLDT